MKYTIIHPTYIAEWQTTVITATEIGEKLKLNEEETMRFIESYLITGVLVEAELEVITEDEHEVVKANKNKNAV